MIHSENYMLPCINKSVFGVECPGCGLQRSAVLITKGEFTEAFYMYPAIYVLIPFVFILISSFFLKFKNCNKIINTLAIFSVAAIIISFLVKKILTHNL